MNLSLTMTHHGKVNLVALTQAFYSIFQLLKKDRNESFPFTPWSGVIGKAFSPDHGKFVIIQSSEETLYICWLPPTDRASALA